MNILLTNQVACYYPCKFFFYKTLMGDGYVGIRREKIHDRQSQAQDITRTNQSSHVRIVLCGSTIMPTSTKEEHPHTSHLFRLFPVREKDYDKDKH